MPKRCKTCRNKKKARFKQIQQEKDRVELKEMLATLPFKYVGKAEIPIADSNTTLNIIGNG